MKRFATLIIMMLGLGILTAAGQTKLRVRFARGAASATVGGTVRGFAYKDYVVGASAGQTLDVHLDQKTSSVFTVFKPNGDNLEGAAEMNEFSTTLPVSGDYVIRVMMMRAQARRPNSISSYRLTISIN